MQFTDDIDIFYDGTNVQKYCKLPFVSGVTTNTAFMKLSGDTNYAAFYAKHEEALKDKPVSFQVFHDDEQRSYEDALAISRIGPDTYVKVPVIKTTGAYNTGLIGRLIAEGIKTNVTAVYTKEQIERVNELVRTCDKNTMATPVILSIFCGRISDTARDPADIVRHATSLFADLPSVHVLWAGCKEVLSIRHAIDTGCHIITVPDAIMDRLGRVGKDLREMSLETVRSFHDDAVAAGVTVV